MSRGGSQSARGAPGEAARAAPGGDALAVGGHLPNYTVYGTQHRNYPTKDKAAFASVPERAEWTRKPRHQTRTELLEARRLERHPDISADIDGDGVVGATDYFIAKQFSNRPCEDKLRLNTGERRNVVEALEGGLLDKYSFGHDQAGSKRPFAVQQRRGMVVTVDNAHELSKTYPAHPISQHVPRHFTRTQMKTSQRAEVKFQNEESYDKWAVNNPFMIPEQQPVQEGRVEQPTMTSVSQRTEARKESARERAGLDVPGSLVNPARDGLRLGLGYREAPDAPTRTELLEGRRARKNEELHEARKQGEQDYVPRKVSHVIVESENFERGRRTEEPMTLTRLRFDRKIDGMEHNHAHFGNEHLPQPARYSDQSDPWWTLQEGYVPEPPACLLRELQNPRAELPVKPTQAVPRTRRAAPQQPASARELRRGARGRTNLPMASVDPVVVSAARQMSQDFAPLPFYNEKEHKRNAVHNAQTFSSDSATMESFSTLTMGVPDSQNPVLLQQERRAKEALETARAWRAYTQRGGDPFDTPPASPLKLAAPMASRFDTSEESRDSTKDSDAQRVTLSKNATRAAARNALMGHPPPAPASDGQEPRRPRPMPLAQDSPSAAMRPDLPMTARLDRLGGTTGGEGHLAGMNVTQPAAAIRMAHAGGGSTMPRGWTGSACPDASASHVRVRSSGFQWLSKRMEEDSLPATARSRAPAAE